MPHLTVHASERHLAGHEAELIAALTDAVVDVYGTWARPTVAVLLVGVPSGRWGVGGTPASDPAPVISFGMRQAAFDRPDAAELVPELARAVTGAVGAVLGDEVADAAQVELVAVPPGRTAVGGALIAD